ncbi:MAG: hypothetical protein ACREV6_12140 [Clostridium sp.]|uniref:hypothetical protein n=1 Tax=Clostridium sp. TaxID=1506 RepID=UPI003D6D4609
MKKFKKSISIISMLMLGVILTCNLGTIKASAGPGGRPCTVWSDNHHYRYHTQEFLYTSNGGTEYDINHWLTTYDCECGDSYTRETTTRSPK